MKALAELIAIQLMVDCRDGRRGWGRIMNIFIVYSPPFHLLFGFIYKSNLTFGFCDLTRQMIKVCKALV